MTMTTLTHQSMTITTEELDALEAKVRTGLASFVETGNVLMEIRDRGGYKRRGYKTFEEYCGRVFGITDRHGRRLIMGAETAHKVEQALGPGQTPKNEGVARELEKVADDPVVLGKVQAKLATGKKPLTIATATAEKVAEVVAWATGKPKPVKASPVPKPNGHATSTAPELGADSITSIQATLTSVRVFLSTHAWLKDNEDAHALVKQLDTGRALLEGLLANAYAARAGARPSKPGGKVEMSGPPRCPSCKQAITPGETFCGNCGSALE